ncbi:MAG TPA: hypothetical protein VH254_07370 [Candidatus Udaeobacter sp.]|jgi:hypothetical protein|nr:hypothetical protein [Candidatus Udaeobacter sp.]
MKLGSGRSPAKAKVLKLAGAIVLIAVIPLGLVNPLFAIIPCFIAYLLLRRGKKHAVKIGESVLKDDARPPVLYLRSFKDESADSSVFQRFKGIAYSEKTWLAQTVPNNSIQEQDALGYVFRKIGPYIALGKPGEELPELGSSKVYTSNDEWQNSIRGFFEKSRLVIFRAGLTESLKWELAEIVRTVSPQKVLMILPLKAADYRGFIEWANSIMPQRLSEDYPTSRLVKFDSDWMPCYLPQGRTLTESLRPFVEDNGIVLRESYWEKILETNGLRW